MRYRVNMLRNCSCFCYCLLSFSKFHFKTLSECQTVWIYSVRSGSGSKPVAKVIGRRQKSPLARKELRELTILIPHLTGDMNLHLYKIVR